jgi:hypothetical protein
MAVLGTDLLCMHICVCVCVCVHVCVFCVSLGGRSLSKPVVTCISKKAEQPSLQKSTNSVEKGPVVSR